MPNLRSPTTTYTSSPIVTATRASDKTKEVNTEMAEGTDTVCLQNEAFNMQASHLSLLFRLLPD